MGLLGNIFYQFLLIEGGVIKFHTHIQYGKGSLHIKCGGNNENENEFNKFKGESSPKKGKNTIRDGNSTVLYTVYTVYTVQTALQCLTNGMYNTNC